MNPTGDLIATLRESLGYVVTGTIAGFFLLMALMLFLWRGMALDDDEEEENREDRD